MTKGAAHPNAKLSEHDVEMIRGSEGVSQAKLAKAFGVSRATISLIRAGKIWTDRTPTVASSPREFAAVDPPNTAEGSDASDASVSAPLPPDVDVFPQAADDSGVEKFEW